MVRAAAVVVLYVIAAATFAMMLTAPANTGWESQLPLWLGASAIVCIAEWLAWRPALRPTEQESVRSYAIRRAKHRQAHQLWSDWEWVR